ncbi:hypothetical protein [Streptomyces arenae]|uniref:hypothetical protein n=1 Tax=Streptomyces arenae TaxID=29301 RepID=UPI00265A00A6|nr:hypothetical protein [Streptomyces arenae]MCG7210009.1 hypothetical protein [Streptomyces arenae]
MRRRVTPVRAGAAAAALVLGGAGVLLGAAAGTAQAAEVSYATHCVPPAGVADPIDGTTKVDITAPATAKVGDTVDITWKFVQAASKNPDIIDLPADSVQPSGTLKAAGAQSADIAMQGPRKNPAIPKGGDMVLSDMTGTLKLTSPGEVTLTPDAYTVNAYGTNTVCTPTGTVAKAATIEVSGTGSTGSASPTDTTSASASPSGSASPSDSASASASASSSASASPSDGTGGQTDFTGKEVEIPYACKTPIGDKNATSPVQINAKKDGGGFDLTVRFNGSVMDSPADIPADSVKPSMEVVLGGADKGTVHVEGPTNSSAIKSGDPIDIPDLTGTYKPGASGTSTLSPGVLTVKALGTTTTCIPTKTEVSLTLDTTQQASGASGSTTTSGGSSSSGSGGLAETGDSTNGALKALGLVAGTAILLGGAVFTFMPKRRTR